ncbi:MAG: hypothetical protein HQ485_01760 [Acidobacteria bacterium]|nr:hypothetical protein [Acidobacteriota bacterium]
MTETNTPPNPAICSQGTQRDRTNLRRYQVSLLIWAVTLLAATFLIKMDRVTSEAAGIGLALLPSLLAFVPAMAFLRFLREADELQRLIQLQAMALALGAAFIVFPAVRLLESVGVAMATWRNDVVPMIVIITYMAGTIAGQRRYR